MCCKFNVCWKYILQSLCAVLEVQNTCVLEIQLNTYILLGVHLKCKEPRGNENVRADSGRGENNVTKLRYTHTSLRALASRPITEDRAVIATTGELASRPITED